MDSKRSIIRSSVIAGIITISVIILFILLMPKEERSFSGIVGFAGALFSFAGVIIAIIQMVKVQTVSETASQAANEAKIDLKKVLSITEFAQIVSIIRKIKLFVRDGKYELAIERISDVKDFLDRLDFIGIPQAGEGKVARFKNKLDVNMNDLERMRIRPGYLDRESFMKDMEDLVTLLNQMDNQIKDL